MKKHIFNLCLLVLVSVCLACENEPLEGFDFTPTSGTTNPQNPGTTNASVVGTWKLIAWNATNAVDVNNDGTASVNLLEELNCYQNETLVFNADNTAVNMSTSYADIELTLIVGTTNDYEFNVNCIQQVDNTNATWTQAGNIVAITESGATNNFTLNNNQLSFLIPSGFNVQNNDGSVTVNEDLTLIYERQ